MASKRVLFVEDDDPKLAQIKAFLDSLVPAITVTVARSLNTACKTIDEQDFDIVLLDMSLPTFDGGKTIGSAGRQKTFGGKEILSYLWEIEKEIPVHVITQFQGFDSEDGKVYLPELHEQLQRDFPGIYQGHIHFEHDNNAWKKHLTNILIT